MRVYSILFGWRVSSIAFGVECESLLDLVRLEGQLDRFWSRLTTRDVRQRDSALNELRVACHLRDHSFRIVDWEPVGAKAQEGEFLIEGPSGAQTFVEVKSPSWQGELFNFQDPSTLPDLLRRRALDRVKLPKDQNLEGGPFNPVSGIRFAIEKTYPKLTDSTPNLLVIADDLRVGLEHGTEMRAAIALSAKDGCFGDSAFERVGGVGMFWLVNDCKKCSYEMALFVNPHSLSKTRIPDDLRSRFSIPVSTA